MSDMFGGLQIPVPTDPDPNDFPPDEAVGDPLLKYTAQFLTAVIRTYVGAAWESIQPGKPIIRTIQTNDPDDIFIESQLPALYVYRPKRATREAVEMSVRMADDYQVETSRLVAQWIMDPSPQVTRAVRNQITNAVRKVVDRAILVGRDKAWIVPADLVPATPTYDAKAAINGSSLMAYTGYMTIELTHAAPGEYVPKMASPAPSRSYDDFIMSFYLEELLVLDPTLTSDPNTQLSAGFVSPDQGTGLGPFDLGDTIYT